jgi:hypothetical protein
MSVSKAWKAYRELDSQQKSFLKQKQLRSSRNLEDWIEFFSGIVDFDRQGDMLRLALIWFGVGMFPIGIVLAIATGSGQALLATWAVGVVILIFWMRLRKIDVPEKVDRFILPWLVLLREDIARDTTLELAMDLRGNMATKKKLEALSGKRDIGGWKVQVFHDNWFQGKTTLADGAKLQWDITDLLRQRKRSTTNARGKTKWKTKYKLRRTFDIHLAVRGKDYAIQASIPTSSEVRTDVKTGDRRSVIRVRTGSVETKPDTTPELVDLVQAVSQAYGQIARPASTKENG